MPAKDNDNKNLFELHAELQELIDRMNDNIDSGLPDNHQQLAKLLDEAAERLDVKLDHYADYMGHCKTKAATIKLEMERLAKLKDHWEGKHTRLKALLKYFMERRGIKKLETNYHIISIVANGGNPPVLWNENAVPEEFASQYPDMVKVIPAKMNFDSEKVLAHLKAGGTLEFAQLGERGSQLRIK